MSKYNPEKAREFYKKHRKRLLKKHRAYYYKDLEKSRAKCRKYARKHKKANSIRSRQHRHKLREEFLTAYGSKCKCCGETTKEFLTLEHKRGDGKQHRKKVGGNTVYHDLKRRGWPKHDYELLCFNCNLTKHIYGICPHKRLTKAKKTGRI